MNDETPWIRVENQTRKVFLDEYAPLLAKEMGGTYFPEDVKRKDSARIHVGDVIIRLQRIWRDATRVRVFAIPARALVSENIVHKLPEHRLVSATFDTSRKISTVAKSIRSRVIEANKFAFQRIKDDLDWIQQAETALENCAIELMMKFDDDKLQIRLAADKSSCALVAPGKHHFQGHVNPDGSIRFEDIATLNADKAHRIIEILLED